MPRLRPLHGLILFVSVPLLHFADERDVIFLDLLYAIIGQLAILLFDVTLIPTAAISL